MNDRRITRVLSVDAQRATDVMHFEFHHAFMKGLVDAIPAAYHRPWWPDLIRVVSGPRLIHEMKSTKTRLLQLSQVIQTGSRVYGSWSPARP